MSQIDELMPLVDDTVGVIRSLHPIARGDDEPEPPVLYRAVLSNFDFISREPMERESAGKGLTNAAAMGGAIGEAIERYCATHIGVRRTRRASLRDLEQPAISPAECVLFSERQYRSGAVPFQPVGDDTTINWTCGVELPAGNAVWIPELLTYLATTGDDPREYFCPPNSNGLAAGPDIEAAIVAGLRELAERDAFVITWLNRLPVPRVEIGDSGPAAEICRQYRRFGVETVIVALATDLPIYAMMALAIDRDRPPACVVGLGCDLDPASAALKALFEICQLRPTLVRNAPRGSKAPAEYETVRTLGDHSAFFADPANFHEIEYLLSSPHSVRLDDLADHSTGSSAGDLAFCVRALTSVGCRVAYVDLTTPDVAPFPIRAVRTIATGLQPIHFGFGMERLGGRRLYDLPCKLGYAGRPSVEAELNRCPHPLP